MFTTEQIMDRGIEWARWWDEADQLSRELALHRILSEKEPIEAYAQWAWHDLPQNVRGRVTQEDAPVIVTPMSGHWERQFPSTLIERRPLIIPRDPLPAQGMHPLDADQHPAGAALGERIIDWEVWWGNNSTRRRERALLDSGFAAVAAGMQAEYDWDFVAEIIRRHLAQTEPPPDPLITSRGLLIILLVAALATVAIVAFAGNLTLWLTH
jgi:hypothetical protein